MVTKSGLIFMFVVIVLNVTIAQRTNQQENENLNRFSHSTFYGDDELRVETKSQAPYWIDPRSLEQSNYVRGFQTEVKLQCLAGGEPQPEITWLKNGIPIKQSERHPSLKPYKEKPAKGVLIIPGMTEADEGTFTCLAKNMFGILRHDFKVEYLKPIIPKPILTYKSPNQTVLEGMSANFTCKFKTDLSYMVYWARPSRKALELYGENFNRSDENNFESVVDPQTKSIAIGENMFFNKVQQSDSGIYFCIGHTNSGTAIDVVHLTVLNKTEAFLEKPENLSVLLGSSALFSCKTHLSLREFSSWVKISDQEIKTLAEGTETYRINNVTEDDLGSYACVVGTNESHIRHVVHLEAVEPNMITTFANESKKLQALAAIIGAVFILLFAVTMFLWRKFQCERLKKQRAIENARAVTQWTKKVIIERQNLGPESPISTPVIRIEKHSSIVNTSNRSRLESENTTLTTISEYELPLDPDWEWQRSDLKLGSVLGEGAFGKVVKAKVICHHSPLCVGTTVAVKMLKEGHTDNDMIDLVSEMDMMKMIGKHVNIINLIGVCTQDGPLLVIVEYAQNGNLRDFLRKHNNFNDGYERPNSMKPSISEKHLISFARQVCKGMEYLHSMKCIHRDLAARNVLVSKDFIVKIADFGLARDVHKTDYYRKLSDGWLPIRWMAPEAIFRRTYTTKSDVWSFGILLWEIMTMGASPYPSVQSMERLFEMLSHGYRMEKPSGCPDEVYTIMRMCWNSNPMLRPCFSNLVDDLDKLLTMARDIDYLDMGSSIDNSTCETMLCQSIDSENTNQNLQMKLSSPPDSILYDANTQKFPNCKPPLPPMNHEIYFSDDFPSGFSSLSEENHANMTYSEIEDATLRSMSSTPWNNNNYQQGSIFYTRSSSFHNPYVNHPANGTKSITEYEVQLNQIRAEDYQEINSHHIQSSNF